MKTQEFTFVNPLPVLGAFQLQARSAIAPITYKNRNSLIPLGISTLIKLIKESSFAISCAINKLHNILDFAINIHYYPYWERLMKQFSVQTITRTSPSSVEYGTVSHVANPEDIQYPYTGDFIAGQHDADVDRLAVGESRKYANDAR